MIIKVAIAVLLLCSTASADNWQRPPLPWEGHINLAKSQIPRKGGSGQWHVAQRIFTSFNEDGVVDQAQYRLSDWFQCRVRVDEIKMTVTVLTARPIRPQK